MSVKLVIVDDAPFIRESIRHLLRGTEFECIGEACNGEEAVALVSQLDPDVVIMDLVLPLKNGIEATREIKALNMKAKIVACSTEGQDEMLLLALKAGCSQFIKKPYEKDDILKALRTVVDESDSPTSRSRRIY